MGNSTRVGATLVVLGCAWMLHSGPVDLYGGPALYEAYAASATLSALLLVGGMLTLLFLFRRRTPGAPTLNAFESGVVAAILGWCTWTLSRNCEAVLSSSRSTDLRSLLFWALAVIGALGFVLSVHFFNLALQHGNVSVAVPSFMGTGLLGGPLFSVLLLGLGWRHGLAPHPHIPALFGIAVVIAGVFLIGVGMSVEDTDAVVEATASKLKQRRIARPGLFPNPDLLFERRDAVSHEEGPPPQPAALDANDSSSVATPDRRSLQPGWGSGLFESVEPTSKAVRHDA